VLDRRLDARVDDMMSRGLVAELAHFHHLYNERRLQDEIKYRLDTFFLVLFFFFFEDYFSHSAPFWLKITKSKLVCRYGIANATDWLAYGILRNKLVFSFCFLTVVCLRNTIKLRPSLF
jgi:hypothetical protein